MWDPNLLIGKLGAVDALRLRSIVVHYNLTTLHHEARDDPLENTRAIVQVPAELTRAKGAEILHSPRQLVLEELHHDAAILVALLSLCSNLDVHEDLDVLDIEVGHSIVDGGVLITVQTITEEFCGSLALLLTLAQIGLIHTLL